jgi:hypothetical protein
LQFTQPLSIQFEDGCHAGRENREIDRVGPQHGAPIRLVTPWKYGWCVMMGLRMYSFIDVIVYCLNYVRSVELISAAFNPSWQLTAVGAAVAIHAASRWWLSLLGLSRLLVYAS